MKICGEQVCEHFFDDYDKDGYICCGICAMRAEDYYERKFNTPEQFVGFLMFRLLEDLAKQVGDYERHRKI